MKKKNRNKIQFINSPCYSTLKLLIIIKLLLLSGELSAAQWKSSYGAGAAINYIDNILLSKSGSEQSDIVYEATPFITVQADSGRTNLEFYYQLQALNYAKNDNANTVYHQLYANMNIELSKNFLFLDLQSTKSQNIISTSSSIPVGNLSISGNRTNVTTYSISPYIEKKFSGNTKMLLRGTFDKTYYDKRLNRNIGSGVENRIYNFSLSNDAGIKYIGWGLNFNRSEFSSNVLPKNFYEEKSLTLSYNKSQQFTPFVTAGNEKNSIDQTMLNSGGGYWSAGLEWNPTSRTSISIAKGARFYGDTSRLSWETQGRFLTIGVDYNETVTSSSTLLSQQSIGQVQQGTNSFSGFEDITATVFVSKRFTSRIIYKKSKTTIAWQAYSDDRKYISTGEVQKYLGGNVSVSWRAGSRTEILLAANWRKSKGQTAGINTVQNFSLGASRAVSSKLRTSLGYRYRDNKVNSGGGAGYVQNIIYLNVNAEF